jgi:hypothetical protein
MIPFVDEARFQVRGHRLDESLGESRALPIRSYRGHHQVTMGRHGSAVGADEADVCRHSDEFTVVLSDDDLTILIRGGRVGSPATESGDDLTDFCEPWDRSVTDVEGVQRFGVGIVGMTQDHESVDAIDEIGPFGSQVLLPVDLGARRPR